MKNFETMNERKYINVMFLLLQFVSSRRILAYTKRSPRFARWITSNTNERQMKLPLKDTSTFFTLGNVQFLTSH